MMSDELIEIGVAQFKLMVIQPSLIRNLVGNELSVVSCWNTFINMLTLIQVLDQISEHKLCHLNIVRENVDWEVSAFGNGNEFSCWIVVLC